MTSFVNLVRQQLVERLCGQTTIGRTPIDQTLARSQEPRLRLVCLGLVSAEQGCPIVVAPLVHQPLHERLTDRMPMRDHVLPYFALKGHLTMRNAQIFFLCVLFLTNTSHFSLCKDNIKSIIFGVRPGTNTQAY